MKKTTLLLAAMPVLMVLNACSAITDFQTPDHKIDIGLEVSEDLTVTLEGSMGTVQLIFDSELPIGQEDAIFELIETEVIRLSVYNDSNVGVYLTDRPVDVPSAPGEYAVQVPSDGSTVQITFYNGTIEGYALHAGNPYHALLEVRQNAFFETGDFVFHLTVE